jgi:hypothetical protein
MEVGEGVGTADGDRFVGARDCLDGEELGVNVLGSDDEGAVDG